MPLHYNNTEQYMGSVGKPDYSQDHLSDEQLLVHDTERVSLVVLLRTALFEKLLLPVKNIFQVFGLLPCENFVLVNL